MKGGRFDVLERRLLDVLIRAGLILALAMLCYRIFSPFLVLMVWALILAVTLYPLHQALAARMGGRQGWAATLITAARRRADRRAHGRAGEFDGRLGAAADRRRAAEHAADSAADAGRRRMAGGRARRSTPSGNRRTTTCPRWSRACSRRSVNWPRRRWRWWPASAAASSKFVAAFIIAGIMMAFGEAGDRASRAIFARIVGAERGDEFTALSVATIRAVAQGVIGIAFIQAILVGLCLLVAGVPLAGVLAVVVLVLGIAQVPALIVTLPAIAYLWMSGGYGTVEAAIYSVLLFVAGMADNVLKPLMLGRGVDAPMPVILLGALGGMATAGILGLFVGATLLALGYQIFMGWVAANPEAKTARRRQRRDRGRLKSAGARWQRARGLVRMAVPAAVVLLGGCTTLGPDFRAPQVPWLQGWSGGAWRTLADEAPRRTRTARRRMVAPVRRPGARPAGGRGAAAEPGRAHRRPAHHGGARPLTRLSSIANRPLASIRTKPAINTRYRTTVCNRS